MGKSRQESARVGKSRQEWARVGKSRQESARVGKSRQESARVGKSEEDIAVFAGLLICCFAYYAATKDSPKTIITTKELQPA